MEDLAIDPRFWRGRRVLVTGHTGFKGAWLAFWLSTMDAKVSGVALEPRSAPSLFSLLKLQEHVPTTLLDINDRDGLRQCLAREEPEVILHLAAQALVRPSYREPVETFAANVLGVVTLLDAVRRAPSVRAVIIVTSDKCYENREWDWGYRENDQLGGRDPYSASKGCAEIAAAAMQKSFFAPYARAGHAARIATVRAGNVIGGGDWSEDRLVPDIIRGCLGPDARVLLRNPHAVRPWQHVLEPLAAYLGIAQLLVRRPAGFDEAWNIGPDSADDGAVIDVAQALSRALGRGRVIIAEDADAPHEAGRLRLDCAKARTRLGWRPLLRLNDAIELTAEWYRAWHRDEDVAATTRRQLSDYVGRQQATWAK
jgi:CDP-glucose 4,6-dehydratase